MNEMLVTASNQLYIFQSLGQNGGTTKRSLQKNYFLTINVLMRPPLLLFILKTSNGKKIPHHCLRG